jgi:hypothetical protein
MPWIEEDLMATWIWILIAVIVIAILAAAGMAAARQRRTAALRARFGPEYDQAVRERGDKRAAENELLGRQHEREKLDIRPLPEPDRVVFAAEWSDVQESFVDRPSDAVIAADLLVSRVMEARGYPMGDFEAQASLVSVDHPGVVANYRAARDLCEQARAGEAGTEDLREALLRYRSLFSELLEPAGDAPGDSQDSVDDHTNVPGDSSNMPGGDRNAAAEVPAPRTPVPEPASTANGTTSRTVPDEANPATGRTAAEEPNATTSRPAAEEANGTTSKAAPEDGSRDAAGPGYQDAPMNRRGR